MKKIRTICLSSILSLALFCMNFQFAHAIGAVELLEPIPGFIVGRPSNLGVYVQGLFRLSFALITGLAVVSGTVGAFTYLFTAVIPQKASGLEQFQSALIGVALSLVSVTILFTINPALTRLDFVDTLERIEREL